MHYHNFSPVQDAKTGYVEGSAQPNLEEGRMELLTSQLLS